MAKELVVRLVGDTSSLDRALGNSQKQSSSFAKSIGKAGVAGAVLGLGAAVKLGFDEFNEAQRVTAQTNAVLKSTGSVAGVTSGEVQKLAESLMRKSGVDDEAIQSGQNMLLTFTKIRNETGKGNQIFDQATKATLDLSVAMGKDMQSSAILVGKALNDPIKGMSALSKAGIQFTEEQKTTIKTMVATGDTMGAQKLILKELETQFGGSAAAAGKTFSGQINIAKQSLLNLAGEGVAKAGPALGTFATKINEDVVPILRRFYNWFNENIIPVLKSLATVARQTWEGIAKVLKEHEPELRRIFGALEAAARLIGTTLLWLFNNVWLPVIAPMLRTAIPAALALTIGAFDKLFASIGFVIDKFVWLKNNAGSAIRTVWNTIDGPLGQMKDAFNSIAGAVGKVIDGIEWLIRNVSRIPKIPFLGGDPFDPTRLLPPSVGAVAGVTGNDATINPSLWDELGLARRFGLTLTSGYRPGAITASGHPSDHSVFPSKAIDVAGSAASMAGFFRALIGNRGVKQAFYDPLGSIFGGTLSGYREGGHSDHVHVATYDRGGYLRPGWNLAYNGTGMPEPVGAATGGPQTIVVQLGDTTLARLVRNAKGRYEQQNGRGAF